MPLNFPSFCPDCTEDSACLRGVHCSLSASWLYSLHLSYKRSNMNRALNVSGGYSALVRLLFFWVREKPGVRLREHTCTDIFGTRHSLHELELKPRSLGTRSMGIGMFGEPPCVFLFASFVLFLPLFPRGSLFCQSPRYPRICCCQRGQSQRALQKN